MLWWNQTKCLIDFFPENSSRFQMPLTASDISRTDVWAPVWCAFQPKHSRHLQAWDCSLILISKACSPSPAALEMEVNDSCMKSNPSPRRAGITLLNVPAVYLHAFILYLSSGKLTVFRWPHVLSFFPLNLSKSIKLFHLLPRRLIRCNLKSKILDSTFSDGIACMFCMAVWIKDWLSLLLSCSNLCPVSLQTGNAEFPEQSGLTAAGRYRLRHLNTLKCKAKSNIKWERMRQPILRITGRLGDKRQPNIRI